MATKNIVPRVANEGSLGKESKPWGAVVVNTVTTVNHNLKLNSSATTTTATNIVTANTFDNVPQLSNDDPISATILNAPIQALANRTAYINSSFLPLAGGTVSGAINGVTAEAGDNSTKLATTAFVRTAISNLVGAAPTTLDTLEELAAALGKDENWSTSVATQLGSKANVNASGHIVFNNGAELWVA